VTSSVEVNVSTIMLVAGETLTAKLCILENAE
jgi:hypothetical protein